MKVFKGGIQRLYWKNSEQPFIQPILSSNGTLGGDKFAVSQNTWTSYTEWTGSGLPAYGAFDGNFNTIWLTYIEGSSAERILTIYNPQPIRCVNFTLSFMGTWIDAYHYRRIQRVYASNDGNNWTLLAEWGARQYQSAVLPEITYDLTFTNNNYYKYYRLNIGMRGGNNYDGFGLRTCTLTAYLPSIVQGTPTDYDYYTDVPSFKVRKINNKYYGLGE